MTKRKQALRRAYIDGRNAYLDGVLKTECPIPVEDLMLRIEWGQGYEDAFAEFAESFAGGNET